MRVTFINLWPKAGMLHYSTQLANALAEIEEIEITAVLARGTRTHLFSKAVRLEFVDVVTGKEAAQLLTAPFKTLKTPQFLKTIRRTKPDVIHVNSSHVWLIPTLPLLAKAYPVVATVHDVYPHPGQDDTWRKRLERKVAMRWAHKIFVHGEKIKQQLLAAVPGRAPEDVHITPHGEYSFFTRWVSNVEREEATVLFFGRMREYKGLSYLIDAAPKVAERIPGLKILVAGEGDLGKDRGRLAKSALFEVRNEYIPDEMVSSYFQRASLVVLPYIEASQSGIIPIAYAFRLPVVATSVGCLSDVVEEGVTGTLVPPCDPDALAEATIDLLSSPEKRRVMGENAYKKLNAELGWDKIARRVYQVYEELIAKV